MTSIFRKIAGRLRNYYRLIFLGDTFVLEVRRWFLDKGDSTLRFDYRLTEKSVVFDVGGYAGSWAKAISDKFSCAIFVFEPIPEFAEAILNQFAGNRKVKVYSYGLSAKDGESTISLSGDGSSFHVSGSTQLANARTRLFGPDLLTELGVNEIDLMKINIEGGEYDLLELMIGNKTIGLVRNLQIQFHNFVPNAIKRRRRIRDKLRLTHSPTWCYEFVWENWTLNGA